MRWQAMSAINVIMRRLVNGEPLESAQNFLICYSATAADYEEGLLQLIEALPYGARRILIDDLIAKDPR